MPRLPKKAAERISAGLKRFQPILAAAKSRDVNESDTSVIVTDLLQEAFGYDKYSEITSEHMIRGTYVDLAVKLDGALAFLIEVKAIGLELKEQFIKQAVDYAANQGVDWVALTNGALWKVYKISFGKPIAQELVVDLDLLSMNPRNNEHVELLGLLAKEGWQKDHLDDYHAERQALNRFTLGALLLSDSILNVLRREIRRLSPEVRVDTEEIKNALEADVLKREVLEGEKAALAQRQVGKAASKSLKVSKRETKHERADPQSDGSNANAEVAALDSPQEN